MLDELISMQLLAAQAEKDGLQNDPDIAGSIAAVAHPGPGGRSVAEVREDPRSRRDAELHAEYDTAIAGMDKTEYKARHILVPSKELAEQLIKKIKGGAKFEDLAKANSTDKAPRPTAATSAGSIPRAWSSRSAMP